MTYMTKEEIWAAALRQSAVDLNCSPEDFGREHSVVVRSAPHAGARKYLSLPFFCDLVSYGGNVVASVAPEAEAAVRAYVERYAPEHCFETPNMNVLADALRPFGMRICFMAEYFLPDVSRMRQWDCGYALKVLGPAAGMEQRSVRKTEGIGRAGRGRVRRRKAGGPGRLFGGL